MTNRPGSPSARDIANATPITAPTIALGPRELPLGLAQAGALETAIRYRNQ